MDLTDALFERLRPSAELAGLAPTGLLGVVLLALLAVGWAPAWGVLRLGVTLVHELGHAGVGVAVGRTVTGFVLRRDMSGHAVTRGRPSGPGMIAMTWAGYPAPAALAALLALSATKGWSAPLLTLTLLALAAAAPFVRSGLTALVLLVAAAACGALWWWRDDVVQLHVAVGVALVLLVGAWRHVLTLVAGRSRWRGGRDDDAAALAHLTGLPRTLWVGTFALACAAATWAVARALLASVGA